MPRSSPIYLPLFLIPLLVISCKSPSTYKGETPKWNPSNAPSIVGSTATPPHNLPRHEYPFDSNGNYVTAWVKPSSSSPSSSGRSSSTSSAPSSWSSSSNSYSSPSAPKPKPAPAPKKLSPPNPAPTIPKPPAPQTLAQPTPSTRSHVVQQGDTLYSLSRRYGTTVSAIQSANGLSGTTIVNGRTLIIPN